MCFSALNQVVATTDFICHNRTCLFCVHCVFILYPTAFAFAELIDNALSATHGMNDRDVEVQLVFDDNAGHSIIVIDNGCGMSTRKLNDWAIYRLSKHSRHHSES